MQYDSTTPRAHRTTDLTGQTFGRLKVLAFAGVYQGNSYWRCCCTCGTVKDYAAHALKRGKTTSCGCFRMERVKVQNKTHGLSYAPEYAIHNAMIQRCTNPKNQDFPLYGGRGIGVCASWLASFEAFYKDMGPRPTLTHTLERLNGERGYEPGNVVWATPKEQALNRRTTTWLTYNGLTLCLADWARKVGIKRLTLYYRLRAGWPLDVALSTRTRRRK
jgi:hypothetical protein